MSMCCVREGGCCSQPPIIDHTNSTVKDLTAQLAKNKGLLRNLPEKVENSPALRVIFIALAISLIAVGMMALQGNLTSFPQDFIHFFSQKENLFYISCGLIGAAVLTAGSAPIFGHVLKQKDRITEKEIGNLTGNDHWIPAYYKVKESFIPGYIDTSTLNAQQSGKAFMYDYKSPWESHQVSTTIAIATPIYMVATIAYNLVRLVIVPFYILFRMALDSPSDEKRRYKVEDIVDEWQKTALRLIKAPFYTWAYLLASLYSLLDPLNGRKLASTIERDWNEGVTLAEGFWSVNGWRPLWKFEGGGEKGTLGRNGFYLAGCWQPVAVIHYQNNQIVGATSLSTAIDPQRKEIYTIYTAPRLQEEQTALQTSLEQVR